MTPPPGVATARGTRQRHGARRASAAALPAALPMLSLPIAVTAGLLALPGVAQAHLVTSGLGPFYDGALHLLLSPRDLLGLLAAALLAGMRGREAARLTVIALPFCWLLGGLVGLALPLAPVPGWATLPTLTVLGLLVATDVELPPILVALVAGAFGLLHGLDNGLALAAIGAGATSVAGIVVTVLVFVLLTSAAVVTLRAFPARVAVRVAGSWIVAVGILMLGWVFKGVA